MPKAQPRGRKIARRRTRERLRMLLVCISHNSRADAAFGAAVGDAVHRAMVETMNVPRDDKFQIITGGDCVPIAYAPE